MLLVAIAILILVAGFAAERLKLSPATKRRLLLIGVLTVAAVLLLSFLRLGPFALVALVVGAGLAAVQAMQEIGRRGPFEELDDREPSPPPRRQTGMDRREALAVLGLEADPDPAAITAAHKRMIVRAHPDQGGSDYLAAKVNEAKRVLLPRD